MAISDSRILLIAAVGAVLLNALLFGFGRWQDLDRLSRQGVKLKGTITRTKCENRGWFGYSYEVGGQVYEGNSNGLWEEGHCQDGADRTCSDLKPGDQIPIVYLPSEPSISAAGEPARRRDAIFGANIMLSFILPFGLASVVMYRRWQAPEGETSAR